jgi:putative protease
VLFPDDEPPTRALIQRACSRGSRTFVLNDPWQVSLFAGGEPRATLWAGPFCNLANPLALETAASLGFSGAIVSPELAADDFLKLPGRSPLPLGVVIGGNWPLCVARAVAEDLQLEASFRSPKGEEAWAVRYGSLYWAFPTGGWTCGSMESAQAGYSLFIHLMEAVPATIRLKDRPDFGTGRGTTIKSA